MVKWSELQKVASGFAMVTVTIEWLCSNDMHFQRRLIEVEVFLILTLVCTSDSFNLSQQFPIACMCVCVRYKPFIIWLNFRSKWEKLLRDYWREKEKKRAHTHTPWKNINEDQTCTLLKRNFSFVLSCMQNAKMSMSKGKRERERDEHRLYAWNSIRQSQLIDSCLLCLAKWECAFCSDVSVYLVRSMHVLWWPAKKQIKQMAENHKENFYRFNEHWCEWVSEWASARGERTNERQE